MAKLGKTFTSKGKEKMGDFSAIPQGEYVAQIFASSIRPNNKKTGSYIRLDWKIIEGEFKNRMLFSILNTNNPSEQTVEIAEGQLATILEACGFDDTYDLDDTEELHGKPCQIKVIVEAETANHPPRNQIKMYKPAPGYEAMPMAATEVKEGEVIEAEKKQKTKIDFG